MRRSVKLIAAIAVLAAAACLALALWPRGGTIARISRDGTVLREIDLSELEEPMTITVRGEEGQWNLILAQKGRICVEHASCPDQICVHQGWISDGTVPVVCLPNRLVVEIVGREAQVDALAQ